MWSNEWGDARQDTDHPPSWWYHGPALWRGAMRAQPACCVGCLALGALAVVDRLWSGGIVPQVAAALGILWLAATIVGLTTAISSEPKWAIAPHLRHQPSLRDERRGVPV